MVGMGTLVSSRLSYYNEHPNAPISLNEMDHELGHLTLRKKIAGAVATGSAVVALVAIAGLFGFVSYIIGALIAIALVAGLYGYCCGLAEKDLQSKKDRFVIVPPEAVKGVTEKVDQAVSAVN